MTTDIQRNSNWGAQRKQGSDRKNNFAKAGEMLVSATDLGAGRFGRVTSSDFQKALINDFPLDPKKPATMKYGGSTMDNEEFHIDNKNSRKNIKPKYQEDNYQQLNNELNRDLNQIDKTLSQKTKALDRLGGYEQTSSYSNYQPKEFAKPSLLTTNKSEQKQELYSSPKPAEYEDFSPSNIPSRIPKNTLNSTRSKLTQSNNSTSDDFGFQFNKSKVGKYEDESPTVTSYSKPAFETKSQQQKAPEKPKLLESSAQKNKAPENTSLLPKIGSASKSSINNNTASSNLYQDNEKEKEKDVDYNKVFSKPSFKKVPTLPAATQKQPEQKEPAKKGKAVAKIPNEDVHQDRGPLKECPHGCGRSFAADALETHAKVCQKVFQNKRNKFDSTQQRVNDEMAKTMSGFGAGAKGKAANNDKWKQQSEALREKLKQAKSKEEIAKIQAIKEQEENGIMKECPHGCGRKFNENAYEKHVKVCQKVFQNKRNKFDSTQQRVNDEMAQTMAAGFGAKGDKNKDGAKWKEQSEAFRANLKAAAKGKK